MRHRLIYAALLLLGMTDVASAACSRKPSGCGTERARWVSSAPACCLTIMAKAGSRSTSLRIQPWTCL